MRFLETHTYTLEHQGYEAVKERQERRETQQYNFEGGAGRRRVDGKAN